MSIENGDGAFYREDIAFHDIILAELGYDRVRAAVEASRGSLDRMRSFLLRAPSRQHETYRDHEAIVAALKARDPVTAYAAMAEHLDRILNALEGRAAENPQIFTPTRP
jgi:DNA-binding FadR family transcriptional regulator